MGIKTGLNEAFLIDTITRNRITEVDPASQDVIRPYLRGQDIGRWSPDWAGLWMIALKSSGDHPWPWADAGEQAEAIFKRSYPGVYAHLKPLEDGAAKAAGPRSLLVGASVVRILGPVVQTTDRLSGHYVDSQLLPYIVSIPLEQYDILHSIRRRLVAFGSQRAYRVVVRLENGTAWERRGFTLLHVLRSGLSRSGDNREPGRRSARIGPSPYRGCSVSSDRHPRIT